MIFDNAARTDQEPRRHVEGNYAFLNRCSWNSAQNVRAFLESKIEMYPSNHREELIARIRCGDDRHFRSATFELIVFSLLAEAGCEMAVHPELPGDNNTRPDFLVTTPDGHEFYLEAVLCTTQDSRISDAEPRKRVVYDTLNKLRCDEFYVRIEERGSPRTPPSGRRLKKRIKAWLTSLIYDEVREQQESGAGEMPRLSWEHEGWQLDFTAFIWFSLEANKPRRLRSGPY